QGQGESMGEHIEITKISSRGQVVIPKEIREHLGWEAGDHLAVELDGETVILRRLQLESLRPERRRPLKVGLIK
ncbi:MAG: AbrB/MazE/SpoVT family DNA-binding domain-containing protein, partial [Moorella sp. (in: firmicutes)]